MLINMLKNSLLRNLNSRKYYCYQSVAYSSEHKRVPGRSKGFLTRPDASIIDADYIGPPDSKSNLRPVIRYKTAHETELEKRLRLKRIETEQWNQNIWSKHNDEFYKQKLEFTQKHRTHDSDTLSADKMSEFYKTFLDKNWKFHFNYNWEWYRKNFELMLLSLQVNVSKMGRNRLTKP